MSRKKTPWNRAVDGVMVLLLLNQMAFVLTGQQVHEWAGALMLLLVLCHNLFNRRWFTALHKGAYKPRRLFETAVNLLLVVILLGLLISGVVMSWYAFDFLPIRGGRALARRVHIFCAYWGFLLMTIHIAMHWNGIKGGLRRMFAGKELSEKGKRFFSGLSWVVSVYGIYAGYRHEILSFLLLQNEFAMFQEQSIFGFVLDYLAMMGLIVNMTDSFCRRKRR